LNQPSPPLTPAVYIQWNIQEKDTTHVGGYKQGQFSEQDFHIEDTLRDIHVAHVVGQN
jgi:hypothetical protein